MKYLYLTTKDYTKDSADHIYIRELSNSFHLLTRDFGLVVKEKSPILKDIPTFVYEKKYKSDSMSLFLFSLRHFNKGKFRDVAWCISNDFNIILILGLVRIILRKKYKICLDAHLLTCTWKDWLVLKISDIIITTSKTLEKKISLYVRNKNIYTVYGGVDFDAYLPIIEKDKKYTRSILKLPTNKIIVGYVGGFTSLGLKKGIDVMIQAAQLLPENVFFLFVGGRKKDVEFYSTFAKNRGVINKCLFLEKKTQETVRLYEYASDILVIPYPNEPHFRNFGFPMKLYEYLCSDVSIIYSDLDILREVLSDIGTAFRPGDAVDLAEKIQRISAPTNASCIPLKKLTASEKEFFSWNKKIGRIIKIMER